MFFFFIIREFSSWLDSLGSHELLPVRACKRVALLLQLLLHSVWRCSKVLLGVVNDDGVKDSTVLQDDRATRMTASRVDRSFILLDSSTSPCSSSTMVSSPGLSRYDFKLEGRSISLDLCHVRI